MIHERTHCRTCGSKNLRLILDLGKTALANDFLNPEEVANYKISLPLRVVLCPDCSLVQLADTVDPKILYSHYAYITSTSRTMDTHLNDQIDASPVRRSFWRAPEGPGNRQQHRRVPEKIQGAGCEVLGVEPAENIC